MKKVFIPLTGKYLSVLGLGCVTFGREISRAASFEIMDFASVNGITFFDTAASYADGASEEIVGRWLSENTPASDRIMVATKVQPPYLPGAILDSVNHSLKRLKRDTVDLLYLHKWDLSLISANALCVLNDLLKTGKLKMIGASNFNASQLEKVIGLQLLHGYDTFQSLQNNNNLAVREVNNDIINICKLHHITIITYGPMGSGFLSGKYKNGVKRGTRFFQVKEHQDVYFTEKSFERLNRLEEIASITGHSSSHLALAWALHRPNITSVLVGVRSTLQLKRAFEALDFNDPDIFNQLELN